jgi:drug/metabolite transporter (DMT)-like permease
METVVYALLSVLLRSANSVFDRVSYGLRKQSILILNFANNVLPFALLMLLLPAVERQATEWALLLDPRLALFAISIQCVAFAFSYGFRHLTVAKVNVASRMGDLLVPVALLLCGREVHWTDYLFAAAISASTLLLAYTDSAPKRVMVLPAVLITSAIVLQSVLGELFFQASSPGPAHLEMTTAIMGWRSAFCLLLLVVSRRPGRVAQFRELLQDGRMRLNVLLRSLFTVASQLFFVLALSTGQPVIAWPILNSVTLFSMVFASLVIKEHPRRNEVIAIILVVLLALLRGVL